LIEFFSDPELKSKVDGYLAIVAAPAEKPELVTATVREKRDFQKDAGIHGLHGMKSKGDGVTGFRRWVRRAAKV
jgi:hypothetical protein